MFLAGVQVFIFSFVVGAHAEKQPQPISDVISKAYHRQRVLVQGTVEKRMDWETVVLKDQTETLLLNCNRVRQDFKIGDTLVVYGLYQGRINQPVARGSLEVTEWALFSNEAASKKLVEKYGKEPVAMPSPVVPEPTEARLKALDELKSKKLISDKEYKEQRKRILESL